VDETAPSRGRPWKGGGPEKMMDPRAVGSPLEGRWAREDDGPCLAEGPAERRDGVYTGGTPLKRLQHSRDTMRNAMQGGGGNAKEGRGEAGWWERWNTQGGRTFSDTQGKGEGWKGCGDAYAPHMTVVLTEAMDMGQGISLLLTFAIPVFSSD